MVCFPMSPNLIININREGKLVLSDRGHAAQKPRKYWDMTSHLTCAVLNDVSYRGKVLPHFDR